MQNMSEPIPDHWPAHARQWAHVGSPLRPCEEDLHLMRQSVVQRFREQAPSRPLDGLLLGVTPEIASLDWQLPVNLCAVDHSKDMIQAVWPGDSDSRQAICADWLHLPWEGSTFDIAVGDGCLTLMNYPDDYVRLGASVAACLKPDGLFLIRLFCRPESAETVDAVFDDLWSRRIGNFHVFKWRLAMALQGNCSTYGIRVADIWETYHERIPDPSALAAITGWPIEEIMTINVYRGSQAIYTYPRVEEVIDALSGQFSCVEQKTGHYELAERCPLLVLQPSRP